MITKLEKSIQCSYILHVDGKLFATPNIPEVTYGDYAFSKVVKVEEDRVGLDIGSLVKFHF